MEHLTKWKWTWKWTQSSRLFKRFLKIIALVYIYQLAKFCDLTSCSSTDIFKNARVTCTNTHHDVTDLVNDEMVENTKTWISWERSISLLQNKKTLNLCLRRHMLRSYRFVAEVIFKKKKISFTHFLKIWDQ